MRWDSADYRNQIWAVPPEVTVRGRAMRFESDQKVVTLALLKTLPGTGSCLRSPRSKNVPGTIAATVAISELGSSSEPFVNRK